MLPPIWSLLFVAILISLPGMTHAQSNAAITEITIGVPADVLADYRTFTYGRNPVDITTYSGPKSRRDVVEVVLIQQALILGGLIDVRFNLKPYPRYTRLISELENGDLLMVGTSIWLTDLQHQGSPFLISKAVIDNGQFEAGLYTSPKNLKALNAQTLEQIQTLTAASSKDWPPDWTTLTHLNLRQLNHVQDWKVMVKMVSNQRADFLLAPFQQTSAMQLLVDDMTLVPIPGVKIGLEGSRHFAISNKADHADQVYQALEKGLTVLKKNGTILKAYRESGFFNSRTRDWLTIAPQS